MPKKEEFAKETTPKAVEELSKDTIEGFRGGLDINLKRVCKSGKTVEEELSQHLKSLLDTEEENQAELVDRLKKWQNLYHGVKPKKNFPFEGASNVATPIVRSAVDTIFVRVIDALFNKTKVWIVKPKLDGMVESARELEDGLDWFQRNVLKLRKKIFSPLLQAIKTGIGVCKIVYEDRKKTVYRYATAQEMDNPSIHKYSLKGTSRKCVKEVKSTYSGPNLYPVSREDFIISSDSPDIEKALLTGFKISMRKSEMLAKVRAGIYYEEPVERILSGKIDETKEARSEYEGKKTDRVEYTEPYIAYELCTKFDVDEDGGEDDIVVTLHKESGEILRARYSPLFSGSRPFIDFQFYPVEYSFDGEGVCQILFPMAEALDTMVNQMIDRVTLINAPFYLVRTGSGLENMRKFNPGQVVPIDDDLETCMREVRSSDQTMSLANEISWLMSLMDRAVGITPISLGVSTAERPVARDTMLQAEETNKKFQYGINNVRECITELGYKLLEFMAQYQPEFTYFAPGEDGMMQEQTFSFPVESIRDSFTIELAASTELMNQEIRREIYIMLYHMMSDYMTKVGGMAQMLTSPEVPSSMKKIILDANEKSIYILEKILENFPDIKDAKKMIPDLQHAIDKPEEFSENMKHVVMMSADVIAAQQQEQGPPPGEGGGPPGGEMPPEGGPPQDMPPQEMGQEPIPGPVPGYSPEQMLEPPE